MSSNFCHVVNKILLEEELSKFGSFKDKEIPFPKVSLFPIKKYRRFHLSDAKDFFGWCILLGVLGVLGVVGICMQSSAIHMDWGALLGMVITIAVGVSIFNIGLVCTNGRSINRKWIPVSIALLCGAAFFGTTFEHDYGAVESGIVQFFYSPSSTLDMSDERTVYTTE